MDGLKKSGLVICILLFGPLLLLSVASVSFAQTLGDQTYFLNKIETAGVYKAASDSLIDAAEGQGEVEPLIGEALRETINPGVVKSSLEPALISTYSWLEGKVDKPDYSLKIGDAKETFETSLTSKLRAQAKRLPACTSAPVTTSLFEAQCIPPGTNVDEIIAATVERVTAHADIFTNEAVGDGVLTATEAEQLGLSLPAQSPPAEIASVFQFLDRGQIGFIIGALLSGLGILFLSASLLKGVRKISILFLINGVGLLLLGVGLLAGLGALVPSAAVDSTEALVLAFQEAVKAILKDNAEFLRFAGFLTIGVGLAGTIVSTIFISKNKKPESDIQTPVAPSNQAVL